jgi:predicted porin
MRKTVLACACSVAAIVAVLAAPAHADTTDDLLKSLRDKGILTEQEYETLVERKANEEATRIATPPASPEGSPVPAIDSKAVHWLDSGVGVEIGPVAVKLSGSINGFYVHDNGDSPAANRVVVGGLATVGSDSASIRSGFLPSFLEVEVTTKQGGWDVGAHIAFYPGIDSVTGVGGANSPGSPTAFSTAGIDVRRNYLTVGYSDFGELKIGRDIGLFGADAALNDMTLLGVGTAAANAAPSNASQGRVGLGYIYTDFLPQITYTTPAWQGVRASVGVFQPLVTAGGSEVNSTPGFQANLVVDRKFSSLSTHLWFDYITQQHKSVVGMPDYTGDGFDDGVKLTYGPAELLGYYYHGSGLGTTGLFVLSTDAVGRKRDSDGYYVQVTYTLFTKLTLGASYGKSHLSLAPGEIASTLLDTNSSTVGQIRYALTRWLSLVGEYTHTWSTAHNGNEASSDALAVGGIVFF